MDPMHGGGFKYVLFSPRKLGKIPIPILTIIFFRWVGSTTNEYGYVCTIFIEGSLEV